MLTLFKQNKKYRMLLMYQFFSGIGGGIFSIFIMLAVHLIYGNPIYTGIAGFLIAFPRIMSFAVGPIVDRRNKVNIMRITTLLEFLVLALLAFTPLQENLGVLFMFATILVYNMAALFENPAGTAYLPQIVREDEIMQANSFINIVALVGGIAVAAVLFISLGGGNNINFIYGFSAVFLAIAFLFSLFLKNPVKKENVENLVSPKYMTDLKEGVRFIRHNVLLYITIAAVAMSFFGEIVMVNRPMFVEYYIGSQGYVALVAMAIIGGIIASTFVGTSGNKFKLGRFIFILLMLLSVARFIFAFVLPVSYTGGLVTSIASAALASSLGIVFESLNQKIPPENMVGRVDTIVTTFRAIFVAIGALIGGFVGSLVPSVDYIFIFYGVGYFIIGVFMISVPQMRKLPMMNEIERRKNSVAPRDDL